MKVFLLVATFFVAAFAESNDEYLNEYGSRLPGLTIDVLQSKSTDEKIDLIIGALKQRMETSDEKELVKQHIEYFENMKKGSSNAGSHSDINESDDHESEPMPMMTDDDQNSESEMGSAADDSPDSPADNNESETDGDEVGSMADDDPNSESEMGSAPDDSPDSPADNNESETGDDEAE